MRGYGKSPIYKKPDTMIDRQTILKKQYIPLFKMTSKKQRLLNTYLSKPKFINQKFVCWYLLKELKLLKDIFRFIKFIKKIVGYFYFK